MFHAISRVLLAGVVLFPALFSQADSTLNFAADKNSAWGANIGWINCRADGANGAVIGDFICSGFIYSANVGWISLGNGQPVNGIRYSNVNGNDFGVNHDGVGNLRGLAYGANIGWLNFEEIGNPRVDLNTGILSGYVWSANAGWISLDSGLAVVKTDILARGSDSDSDGIADAWELLHAGNLSLLNGVDDLDGDGVADLQEYFANTDPLDANSFLRITGYSATFANGDEQNTLTWNSRLSRVYRIEYRSNLDSGLRWLSAGIFSPQSDVSTSQIVGFAASKPLQRYFRVEALFPLSP